MKYNASKFERIEMKGISKSFPGVRALDGVDLEVQGGTIHAIVGENGAGKSTLIKILAGVYKRDQGQISIDGSFVDIRSPVIAKSYGISVIYQEFSLVPELSISQNIFLGNEKLKGLKVLLDKKEMNARAADILRRLNVQVDPRLKVKNITVGEQQLVEIAKALLSDAKLIIMDEPTSTLSEEEKGRLFEIMRMLKAQGHGLIYITHRMKEIFEIADFVTVMRDGRKVGDYPIQKVDESKVVSLMVGRELGKIFHRERLEKKGKEILRVENLKKNGAFRNISFHVNEGEVLGISGLMGAGRTEIVRCIFGLDEFDAGRMFLGGKEVRFEHPFDAIRHGIGYVPEDRKRLGFVPFLDIKQNISLPSLYWISKYGWVDMAEQQRLGKQYSEKLSIRMTSLSQKALTLSGGNQQKLVLGKWLARDAKLLILDEPTRGIDVGAKSEIHKIISQLIESGIGIIMISSELPEILGMSDRIIVVHEGVITGEFNYREASEEKIMVAATGLGEA